MNKNRILILSILLFFNALISNSQSLQDGIKQLENENYSAALNTFTKLNVSDPKNPLYAYYIGEVHYALENYEAAKTAYQIGLNTSSKCDECRIGLGKLELDNARVSEARKLFDGALKGNNKNHQIIGLVGDAFLYSKKPMPDEALEYLTKARDLDPKIARYWIHLGDAQLAKSDLGAAMTSYETAVEKDKSNPETYVKMARIWSASKKYDLGIEKLEAAIVIKPDYAIAYKELYEQYIKNKNYSKVLPILEKYVSLSGDDVGAKVRLVKFLCFQAKDYERAIIEGNKIIATNPEQYTIYRWLAWSYSELDKAEESFIASEKLFSAVSEDTARKTFPSDYEYFAKASAKLKKMEIAEKTI
ncbi:MAG: tetratricopeptide repeat protein [Saprospiraceae bacterium]|nr:tetratricopeptide repeat protein [Candidatus Vicinibacter affinis]